MSAAALFPAWLPKVVLAENYALNRDIIVSIFQRGGADGLSMCVPFADPDYYTSRSTIAIPRPGSAGGVTALDNFFGLPPAMTAAITRNVRAAGVPRRRIHAERFALT